MTLTMKTDTVERQTTVCCGVEIEHVHIDEDDGVSEAAATFKALADPTRLRILKAIAGKGELCECHIVPSSGLTQPTISYHLKILREAGLVESERRGQWVYHRVNNRALMGVMRNLTDIG